MVLSPFGEDLCPHLVMSMERRCGSDINIDDKVQNSCGDPKVQSVIRDDDEGVHILYVGHEDMTMMVYLP